MYPDDHLMAALKKQAGQYLVGKIKEKGQTPLGLPYLFKRDRDIGMGWTPAMRNTFVGIENEWVEDGECLTITKQISLIKKAKIIRCTKNRYMTYGNLNMERKKLIKCG